MGMKWKNKYYVEKFLAFSPVHGTGFFQRITDFVKFILAQEGITVYNYACHKDHVDLSFQKLKEVITKIGMNPENIFPPTAALSVMGIVIAIKQGTFRIRPKKL